MAGKLFAYVDALCTRNASILQDPDFEKEYNTYIINLALSYHADTIRAANMMNERSHLPKALQALFYISTLAPRKRYAPWVKSTVSDDARLVAEYYGCSLRRARELVSLHTSDQLTQMQVATDKGGPAKGSRHDTS